MITTTIVYKITKHTQPAFKYQVYVGPTKKCNAKTAEFDIKAKKSKNK